LFCGCGLSVQDRLAKTGKRSGQFDLVFKARVARALPLAIAPQYRIGLDRGGPR
jgi:hypothetical protein